jgi:hypothetical protein
VEAAGGDQSETNLRQLAEDIDTAVRRFHFRQSYEGIRSAAAREKALAKVALNADQLLKAALKSDRLDFAVDALDNNYLALLQIQAGSPSAVIDALKSVEHLRKWARAALRNLSPPPVDRHKGLTAKGWLTAIELPRIYEKHFRPFAISTRRRTPGGRGIDFVMACAKQLGIEAAPEAIKKLRNRHKSKRRPIGE